jgi:hypothetical protein
MPYTPLSTANTLQSWRIRINDIDSVKLETSNPTTSGLLAHTGRITVSTNLSVSGNTTLGGTGKFANVTGWFGVNGRQSISTNLFVSGNTRVGGTGKVANVTGWFGVNGRATISTNLFVSGNTRVGGLVANGGLGSSGQFLRTNGTTAHWAPLPSSGITTGKAIAMAIVFG